MTAPFVLRLCLLATTLGPDPAAVRPRAEEMTELGYVQANEERREDYSTVRVLTVRSLDDGRARSYKLDPLAGGNWEDRARDRAGVPVPLQSMRPGDHVIVYYKQWPEGGRYWSRFILVRPLARDDIGFRTIVEETVLDWHPLPRLDPLAEVYIRFLGSSSCRLRDATEGVLRDQAARDPAALRTLVAGTRHADPEVASRCRRVLRTVIYPDP